MEKTGDEIYNLDHAKYERQLVGHLPMQILQDLAFTQVANNGIIIPAGSMKHALNKHPDDYEKYFYSLPVIIGNPDYYGIYPSKPNSIELVKNLSDYVLVGITINKTNSLSLSSFYGVDSDKIAARVRKGRLKPFIP